VQPQVRGASRPFAEAPDCAVVACIALTFDDGPHSVVTPKVLDVLAREQVPATFFVVGSRVAGREYLVQRAYRDGHEIGNHSWNHASFTKLSAAAVQTQLDWTQQAIMRAGVPEPHLFRPPYGAIDARVMAHADLTVVGWNIDPADWHYKNAAKVTKGIVKQAKPGGIILLHDTHITTAYALGPTIRKLKRHYQFVTVSQLLGVAKGDHGLYLGQQQ
jgi:peptidoglycan/xylan/chitin deacetylase (PgdA/CDA1 family)